MTASALLWVLDRLICDSTDSEPVPLGAVLGDGGGGGGFEALLSLPPLLTRRTMPTTTATITTAMMITPPNRDEGSAGTLGPEPAFGWPGARRPSKASSTPEVTVPAPSGISGRTSPPMGASSPDTTRAHARAAAESSSSWRV